MRFQVQSKAIIVFLLSILMGIGFGQQQILAESKSVWVDPVGNVGTALTTGSPSSGAVGRSSSGIVLYTIAAYSKIWHTGPLLQDQDAVYLYNQTVYNQTVAQTRSLSSSGYGDYAVTRHEFRYVPGKPTSITYTSDNGARSCFAAWNTFVYSC